MNMIELNQKRDYLNSLRPFTIEELQSLKEYVISINLPNNPEKREVDGIKAAYKYIEFLMNEESNWPYPSNYKHPLTENMLKSINQDILRFYSCFESCEKGSYRQGVDDYIYDKRLPGREIFIPQLRELIYWYERTDAYFFDKLSIFHLTFLEDIHPFYDGNGRTARTFMNLELARKNYPMISLKYTDLEAYNEIFVLPKEIAYDNLRELIYKNVDAELDRHILIRSK